MTTTLKTFFTYQLVPPIGDITVMVKGKIRRPDVERQTLLQIPKILDERLDAVLSGARGPGLVGLLEFALDRLDEEKKTLVIENASG